MAPIAANASASEASVSGKSSAGSITKVTPSTLDNPAYPDQHAGHLGKSATPTAVITALALLHGAARGGSVPPSGCAESSEQQSTTRQLRAACRGAPVATSGITRTERSHANDAASARGNG